MRQLVAILILMAVATCGFPAGDGLTDLSTSSQSEIESRNDSTSVETSRGTQTSQRSRTIFGVDMKDVIQLIAVTGEFARQQLRDGHNCHGVINLCNQNPDHNSTVLFLREIDRIQENQQQQLQDMIRSFIQPGEQRPSTL